MTNDTLNLITDLLKNAKKLGADAADAVSFVSSDVAVAVRKGELETVERSESQGFGLRVMIGKRKAIVSSTDTRPDTLNEMVSRAVDMAKLAPDDPYTGLADEALFAKTEAELDLYDAAEPSAEMLADQAKKAEYVALSTKGITNSDGADASYGSATIALATSNGFAREYRTSSSSLSVSVVAGEGTQMERDYDYTVARHASDLEAPETIGRNAAARTLKRLNPRKPATGQVPIIFDPRVSKNLLGALSGAINGASIARGTSFLKNDMGKEIFSPEITIINDPRIKRGLASKPYDGEGVEGKKLELIKDGVLTGWLLDIRSANQLGLQTNGAASRGLASNPSPSSSNLYMQNGSVTPQALREDIKSGFYVTETFGTGINLVTGDYSQGASGYWIENGELTYPVSELTIAGTLQHMFKYMIAANDLEFRYGTNCPTLRIDGVTVAGV